MVSCEEKRRRLIKSKQPNAEKRASSFPKSTKREKADQQQTAKRRKRSKQLPKEHEERES